MFIASDFELYQGRFQGDAEWNGRRLEIRHRLQAFGDRIKEGYAQHELALDRRESLHHPHASNHKRVRRQRTMLFRAKKERTALQKFLGKELGKDLDSAMNNVHLQLGLDDKGCYWGLRIDSGAWYDLNVLVKRAEDEAGRQELIAAVSDCEAFQLEIDRRGPRPLAKMNSRDWRDLAGLVRPGESQIELVRRMPSKEVEELGVEFAELAAKDLLDLARFYRLSCWTLDGNCPSGASW